MKIEFLEDGHKYCVDGKEYPSVTQILNDMGLTDFSAVGADVLARAQAFGSAVHKAAELYDKGSLDFSTVDSSIIPYLEGWIKFKKDYDIKIIGIERQAAHPGYIYAGTIDRIAERAETATRLIIDIKTSKVKQPSTALQLAAYEHCLLFTELPYSRFNQRMVVYLKDDGSYCAEIFNDVYDFSVFVGACKVWHWRKNKLGRLS
jgi:hypothetical protein